MEVEARTIWSGATAAPPTIAVMRVEVDADLCTGHGRCWSLAPEVYDADEDGYCATRSLEVPPALEQQARSGARTCPERAITIVEAAPTDA